MRRKKALQILNHISISRPCPSGDFDSISTPGKNGWFCNHCRKNVHDFSQLSARQIAALVAATGGELCASIRRRPDGTMITKEQPANPLVAAGLILAGTTVFSTPAFADPSALSPDGSAVLPPAIAETVVLGEITVPNASPSPPPGKSPDNAPIAVPSPTPSHGFSEMKGGISFSPPKELRGKVSMQSRSKPKSSK